jgi:hypothetical protein
MGFTETLKDGTILGDVPGIRPGTFFRDRQELHDKKLHRGLQQGLAKIETRIQWMRDYQLAYLLNVFRVDYADLYPTSLDPRERYLDERLRKLMNTRF